MEYLHRFTVTEAGLMRPSHVIAEGRAKENSRTLSSWSSRFFPGLFRVEGWPVAIAQIGPDRGSGNSELIRAPN